MSWYVSHVPVVMEDEGSREKRNSVRRIIRFLSSANERRREEEGTKRRERERDRDTECRACRRVDPEINGALITLIEALRRIDTAPIGPVSFRDTDRSYDK